MKTVINVKLDKIKITKHQDKSNKEHTLKKQLDSLRQDFLENNEIINHLIVKVYQASYTLPYYHGYLKIQITKTQILTSTLHMYVTISKHPLKTYHKYQKVTEELHLID